MSWKSTSALKPGALKKELKAQRALKKKNLSTENRNKKNDKSFKAFVKPKFKRQTKMYLGFFVCLF